MPSSPPSDHVTEKNAGVERMQVPGNELSMFLENLVLASQAGCHSVTWSGRDAANFKAQLMKRERLLQTCFGGQGRGESFIDSMFHVCFFICFWEWATVMN
jgi:hypothetical protein